MLKQLIPVSTGGGIKPSKTPSATLNQSGTLSLNSAADQMLGGDKWIVRYEDDPNRSPLIELQAASIGDESAYKVVRASGSSPRINIKLLWQKITHADQYVGRYQISKIAHGIKLSKQEGE